MGAPDSICSKSSANEFGSYIMGPIFAWIWPSMKPDRPGIRDRSKPTGFRTKSISGFSMKL
jgi:hypothetical protein